MTKKWSSTRSGDGLTKRAASKAGRVPVEVEDSCGCVFCDIDLTPERREGQPDPVHMVKGVPMPCLKK